MPWHAANRRNGRLRPRFHAGARPAAEKRRRHDYRTAVDHRHRRGAGRPSDLVPAQPTGPGACRPRRKRACRRYLAPSLGLPESVHPGAHRSPGRHASAGFGRSADQGRLRRLPRSVRAGVRPAGTARCPRRATVVRRSRILTVDHGWAHALRRGGDRDEQPAAPPRAAVRVRAGPSDPEPALLPSTAIPISSSRAMSWSSAPATPERRSASRSHAPTRRGSPARRAGICPSGSTGYSVVRSRAGSSPSRSCTSSTPAHRSAEGRNR